MLDIEPATVPGHVINGNENSEYSVEFDKACLSYNGSEESLHNIDLKIKRGSSIGVIGSTGSGKTSLVNLIPRFYDVTGGCVLVDGVDVRDYDTKALRSKIGVVSQKKALFAGTVRDNIRFGKPDATMEEVREARARPAAMTSSWPCPKGMRRPVGEGGRIAFRRGTATHFAGPRHAEGRARDHLGRGHGQRGPPKTNASFRKPLKP